MPATGPHPVVDILGTVRTDKITAYTLKIRLPDETTVHLEWIYWILQRIVGLICSPTCLLIPRIDYCRLDWVSEVTKRIAVGRDFHPNSILNPFFRHLSFEFRILVQEWMSVVYAV